MPDKKRRIKAIKRLSRNEPTRDTQTQIIPDKKKQLNKEHCRTLEQYDREY